MKRLQKTSVIVADGARARIFRIFNPGDDGYHDGPRLREQQSLVNPEGQLPGADLFGNLKSGRKRSAGGGPAHGLDDRRESHEREIGRRFAVRIARAAAAYLGPGQPQRLIVVAPPHALGALRTAFAAELSSSVVVEDIARELSWHSVSHIEEVLERRGLLTPRKMPARVRRTPGQPLSDS